MCVSKIENQILMTKLRGQARKICSKEIEEFMVCTNAVGFFVWRCKPLMYISNNCILKHSNKYIFEEIRKEYLIEKEKKILDSEQNK